MARRPRRGNPARKRLEGLLDQVSGRRRDRPEVGRVHHRRRDGVRVLDIRRNRDLFAALVQADFDFLRQQDFCADPGTLGDLLPQSVLGRAQNGHGWFTDEWGVSLQFPDATFDRVLTVLEAGEPNLRGPLVRHRRGRMLQDFRDWILANLWRPELVLDIEGRPPFGVEFLAGLRVDTRAFLTGMVLAGYMDDWSTRETAMLQHRRTFGGGDFRIGGGEIHIVDRAKFEMCGLGDTGRVVFDDDQLRGFRDAGVIMSRRDVAYAYPEYDQAYFRRCAGDGVSDDLALIYIARRFGYDAMLGAFVMDAMDTYDKYVLDLTWDGMDTDLARDIQQRFLDREDQALVGDRDILDLIHFAAKRNDPPANISSSHRRFIQVEHPAKVPTVFNHWDFVQGKEVADIRLGYSRIPARELYAAAFARFRAVGEDVPEARFLARRGRRDP